MTAPDWGPINIHQIEDSWSMLGINAGDSLEFEWRIKEMDDDVRMN